MQHIPPARLEALLRSDARFALVDVRELGEYNQAHIAGSSAVPRRLIERRLQRLVPCQDVQVVLCDDDGRRAMLAAQTVESMGYRDVAVLDGGVNRWVSEGFPTEWGLNVLSKDFGEQVEVVHHVPTIDARELQRRVRSGEEIVILDTRTPEEYRQYCIPGGRSLPGGELAYRVAGILEQQPGATVVVNCAGRTRSIIGARILQRMGLPNVVSLKNGTSGWLLAGLQLEQGAERVELPTPSGEALANLDAFASRLADEDGVRFLDVDRLRELMDRSTTACVYLIDVRTEQEFAAGHIPGFWWFPGGQAVQRADDLVAVRNAPIVFCCDGRVRATVTASWFRQMGFPSVYVVDGGVGAWSEAGESLAEGTEVIPPFGLAEAAASVRWLAAAELQASLGADPKPLVLFVDTSREFALGHPPGARWLSRSWLEIEIGDLAPDRERTIVVTDADGTSAALAAATLGELEYPNVAALQGGMEAWRREGLPTEQGLSGVMRPPEDVVPAGAERSYADMIHYLRWEEALGVKYEAR